MFQSMFLSLKRRPLPALRYSTVALLSLLQISLWYPWLSQAHDDIRRQTRLKNQAVSEWQAIQRQAIALENVRFGEYAWLEHQIVARKANVATQWRIEGSQTLAQWRSLLEEVQRRFSLSVLTVSWEREKNAQWHGVLRFAIQAPKANRSFHNWLPTRLDDTRFIPADWQLLSTMRTAKSTSALIEYKHRRHWVQAGSWLPDAGLSVRSVALGQVTLVEKGGALQTLLIRDFGGVGE
ncbi:MAG: hypothetical protein ACPGRG_02505 [Marinomonas sp.]